MPTREAPRFRVAGFWRRAMAGAIDALVLLPVALVLGALTALVGGGPLPTLREVGVAYSVNWVLNSGVAGLAALGMALLVVGLYSFIFHATRGQTLGKWLCGLQVIDGFGARPSLARSLVRTAGYALSALLFSLGFLWIGFDRQKRALHDLLAGTYVVHAPRVAFRSGAAAEP